jgi:hypothetical protein
VFSVALPLALATLSPALPVASVTSNAAIAVCYSPEEDCAAFAVRAIDNAEREILVGAYGLTTGSDIVEALVRTIPQAEWRWLRDRWCASSGAWSTITMISAVSR